MFYIWGAEKISRINKASNKMDIDMFLYSYFIFKKRLNILSRF